MRKIILVFIIIFLCIISFFIINRCRYPYTKLLKIKEIVSGNTIKFSNGNTFQLFGIVIPKEFENSSKEFLEKIRKKTTRAIALQIKYSNFANVYVIGINEPSRDFFSIEQEGFLDLKEHPWSAPKKSLTFFLNALLIREGYAKVNESLDFKNKEAFLALQTIAKEENRGIWSNGRSPKSYKKINYDELFPKAD